MISLKGCVSVGTIKSDDKVASLRNSVARPRDLSPIPRFLRVNWLQHFCKIARRFLPKNPRFSKLAKFGYFSQFLANNWAISAIFYSEKIWSNFGLNFKAFFAKKNWRFSAENWQISAIFEELCKNRQIRDFWGSYCDFEKNISGNTVAQK